MIPEGWEPAWLLDGRSSCVYTKEEPSAPARVPALSRLHEFAASAWRAGGCVWLWGDLNKTYSKRLENV